MDTAPAPILYAYTGKWNLRDDRWADRTVPEYLYEDKEAAETTCSGFTPHSGRILTKAILFSAWRGSKPSP